MSNIRAKTIICDIDGTLIEHESPSIAFKTDYRMKILDGTLDKLLEWDRKGYNIILMTGRKESLRHITEVQLQEIGVFYDQLIMGVGGGQRHLINDRKPSGETTAFSINLNRNEGISQLNLD
jgi:hypothetical protein